MCFGAQRSPPDSIMPLKARQPLDDARHEVLGDPRRCFQNRALTLLEVLQHQDTGKRRLTWCCEGTLLVFEQPPKQHY